LEQITQQVWCYSVQKQLLWTSDLSYEPTGVSGMLHTPKGEVAFDRLHEVQYNLSNLLAAVGVVYTFGNRFAVNCH